MSHPSDIEILNVINTLRKEKQTEVVPLEDILQRFSSQRSYVAERLSELSSDILKYLPGNKGGYKITGNTGHATDATISIWINDWLKENTGNEG